MKTKYLISFSFLCLFVAFTACSKGEELYSENPPKTTSIEETDKSVKEKAENQPCDSTMVSPEGNYINDRPCYPQPIR